MYDARGRVPAIVLLLVLSIVTPSTQQSTLPVDLTGTWTIELTMPGGPSRSMITLRQDGSTLIGDYSSPSLGEHVARGRVVGGRVELAFSFQRNARSPETTVVLTGTVSDRDSLAGEVKLTPGNTGTFAATRLTAGADAAVTSSADDWPDPSPHRITMIRVDNDVSLEVLDWGGSGRPLVFLPGLGNTAHVYDEFAPRLMSLGHVYGITLRGFGRSSAPRQGYDAHRLADDVVAVLDGLQLDRPVLLGHSMSGEELSSLGARYPRRAGALIYLDAAADRSAPQPADLAAAVLPSPPASAADRQSVAAFGAWQLRVLGVVMPESELRQTSVVMANGRVGRYTVPAFVFEAMEAGVRRPDYAHIQIPVLSIQAIPYASVAEARAEGAWMPGRWPDATGATEAEINALMAAVNRRMQTEGARLERELAGAKNVVIRGAHHYHFISHPDDVFREIRQFLSGL